MPDYTVRPPTLSTQVNQHLPKRPGSPSFLQTEKPQVDRNNEIRHRSKSGKCNILQIMCGKYFKAPLVLLMQNNLCGGYYISLLLHQFCRYISIWVHGILRAKSSGFKRGTFYAASQFLYGQHHSRSEIHLKLTDSACPCCHTTLELSYIFNI